jgi:hypothetical protein
MPDPLGPPHFARIGYDEVGGYRDCTPDEIDGECLMCSGAACNKCGAGCWNNDPDLHCEHDVLERHEAPEKSTVEKRFSESGDVD